MLQLLEVGISKSLLLLKNMRGVDVVSIHVEIALNILILILKNLALHIMHVLLRHRHIDHPANLSRHGIYDRHVSGQLHTKLTSVQVHLLLLYFIISHLNLIFRSLIIYFCL